MNLVGSILKQSHVIKVTLTCQEPQMEDLECAVVFCFLSRILLPLLRMCYSCVQTGDISQVW